MYNIILQYAKFEDLIYFICSNTKFRNQIIHRYNEYCESVFKGDVCLEDVRCAIEDSHEHGLCINTDYDTLEFRMVDSGFDVDRFKSIVTVFANLIIHSYDKEYKLYTDLDDEIMDRNEYDAGYYSSSQLKLRENDNYQPQRIKEFLKFLEIEDEDIKRKVMSLYKRNFATTANRELTPV
jgi:hypothetical protein